MAGSITIQNLIDSCLAIHKFRKQKAKIGLEKLSGEAAKTFNHFSEWSERQKFPPDPTQPHVSITIISNYASTRASIQINDVIHILSSYTVLSSSSQNRFVERRCMWSNYKYHYIVRQFMFSSLCSLYRSSGMLCASAARCNEIVTFKGKQTNGWNWNGMWAKSERELFAFPGKCWASKTFSFDNSGFAWVRIILMDLAVETR